MQGIFGTIQIYHDLPGFCKELESRLLEDVGTTSLQQLLHTIVVLAAMTGKPCLAGLVYVLYC